ncbi:MAG TPA: DUF308 domain-containing protein [Terriglobales bacterium]|nr:DUF308 domain-containing protein [Terriglobales bacterium]HVA63323.1 DUF308 domain-containing protein [Terriglobales bacterium]
MATTTASPPRLWGWLWGLGVVLLILGIVTLSDAFLATLASMLVIGWLLVFGGVVQLVHAFGAQGWTGMLLHLAAGVMYVVAGLLLVANPVAAALTLTLLAAFFLFVVGLFRMGAALALRLRGWGWVVAAGAADLVLAALISLQWPGTGFWVIGLFVGIEMLLAGGMAILLAMELRPRRAEAAGERLRPAA